MLTISDRNALIHNHMHLAEALAASKGKSLYSVNFDELRSAAYAGLVDAASKYEAGKGCFRSYARLRISGEIKDFLRSLGFGSRGSNSRGCRAPAALPEFLEAKRVAPFAQIVEGLCPAGRELLRMYYVDGYSLREMAERVGVGESRVSQMLSGYRRQLRAAED